MENYEIFKNVLYFVLIAVMVICIGSILDVMGMWYFKYILMIGFAKVGRDLFELF